MLSRPLGADPAQVLPLTGPALPVPAGQIGVYVSEAVVDLYGVRPGQAWPETFQGFYACSAR